MECKTAIPSAITVPSQSGAPSDPDQTIYRTPQGTPAVASGPKLTPEARQTYTGYSKSMDKTFMMAALQSAIPKNDQTPARQAPSGGGRGGGNRMDQLTPYASAIKLDDEELPQSLEVFIMASLMDILFKRANPRYAG